MRTMIAGAKTLGLLSAVTLALGAAPASAETALNMAVVSRTVFYLPAWMAEQQGFFRQEGSTCG